MTKTINISWDLPTTRVSGNPLDPSDILGVKVSLGAGAGFAFAGSVLPTDPQQWIFPDMVDGDYTIRLEVTTALGDSVPVDTAVSIDDSLAGPVTNVVVNLV